MKKLFWFPVLLLVMVSCQSDSLPGESSTAVLDETKMTVYLMGATEEELKEVRVSVDPASLKTQIEDVLTYLNEGVEGTGYRPVLEEREMILRESIEERNLVLNMSEAFEQMATLDHLYLKASLIKSLTNIETIDSVEFYVEGYPLRDQDGKMHGPYYGTDVAIASMMEEEQVTLKTITLYFPNANGESLVPVSKKLDISNFDNLEKKVVEALMVLPETDQVELTLPIPEEAKINTIRVSNGICYIDFNEEFKTKHYGGSTGEMMTVYSIVNTLTELPNISRVQFLIEGEKTESFKGHLAFDGLFEFNLNLVNQDLWIQE